MNPAVESDSLHAFNTFNAYTQGENGTQDGSASSCAHGRTQVQEGRPFATALAASGAFPDVAVKMIEVGESTGALQEMLNSLADFYDEDIETEVGRFITVIEPALLIVMGVVIAGVVLALYMPLFELSSVVGATA